ncbi:FadR/GntR family transcriptional regulator [Thalassobius sp. Cn5-15]|uniref:FadR/GntR family transcriptional regulator n=1 Tax=Thalassobius sp. Cn5-15 TaxID=2917763 RepID=UPI001EF2E029|nr:GntR family transcriptional regulator [Thalassobius sp. Cn5-15]MCG7492655.1 GntR family transcriptional regulator [Thalassobius sp. Cn5-15]
MSDNSEKRPSTRKPARRAASDLSADIANEIRDSIIDGRLIVDARLPSEAELAAQFAVSRPTVREALKRLAAQSLIRTQRGASGGAFVNRLSYEQAYPQQVTTATLLLSMNGISFATACEARFALERACALLACSNRTDQQLDALKFEIERQKDTFLSDETFCQSDVSFHRTFVDCACNPVLSYQLAGAIEAMQPLMNMITYTRRSRAVIVDLHSAILDALADRKATSCENVLDELHSYTLSLASPKS